MELQTEENVFLNKTIKYAFLGNSPQLSTIMPPLYILAHTWVIIKEFKIQEVRKLQCCVMSPSKLIITGTV
jgi:hypothetical protein